MNKEDLLKYLSSNDTIDLAHVQGMVKEITMTKNLLDKHKYNIWQAADGRWCTYLPKPGGGKELKRRTTREALDRDIVNCYEVLGNNPSVEAVFHAWNDHRYELKQISNGTYTRNRQIFARHYAALDKKLLRNLSAMDFVEFLEFEVTDKDLTAKGFANLKAVTRGLLKYAKRKKLIDFLPDEVFASLDVEHTRKVIKEDYEEVFDEEEFENITSYLSANQDRANLGLLLMFVTGVRVGELAALKREDLGTGCVNIRRTETRIDNGNHTNSYLVKDFPKTKAGVRSAIVPEEYNWVLSKLKEGSGEFVFMRNGSRMHTDAFRKRLRSICKKLGIYSKSPHKIRKTYGTILLDNNVDRALITSQMGHSNITVTETHYHRNRKSLEQKLEILSNIPDFR